MPKPIFFKTFILQILSLIIFTGLSTLSVAATENDEAADPFAPKEFIESPLDLPTQLPNEKNLRAFRTGPDTVLTFLLDTTSLKIGSDKVIRYVVVIKNSSGSSSIKYEGIRCDTFEYKPLGIVGIDNKWIATPSSQWRIIPNQGYNQYQATLGRYGLCTGNSPNTNFKQAILSLP